MISVFIATMDPSDFQKKTFIFYWISQVLSYSFMRAISTHPGKDILKSLENADLDLAKAPGFELHKSPPYYNMDEISEVESREVSLRSKSAFSSDLSIA